MWIIIGLIVVFVLGKFFFDLSKQKGEVAKEGGMANKYKHLIKGLLEHNKRASITRQTGDSVVISMTGTAGMMYYTLIQTFGSLTVKWRMVSETFGERKLEWDFPEKEDQEVMLQQIISDYEDLVNSL